MTKPEVKAVGSKKDVYEGKAKKTAGGLTKGDLTINKRTGKVVSKKQQKAGIALMKDMKKEGSWHEPFCAEDEAGKPGRLCDAADLKKIAAKKKAKPASPKKKPASPKKTPASPKKKPASPKKTPASPKKKPASPKKTPASPKKTPAYTMKSMSDLVKKRLARLTKNLAY